MSRHSKELEGDELKVQRNSPRNADVEVLEVEHDPGFTLDDKRDMQRMGKKQELMRTFLIVSSIGFTSCVMGTWEILLTTNTPALIAGGSAGLFWSMVWSSIGQFFVVLSLAEMSSMAPTAGGQYHWVSEFAPRSQQKVLSYISGWLSALSWQAFVASVSFICASIIQSMISLNNPDYESKGWHTTLLVWACVLFFGFCNTLGAKVLATAENIFVTFHLLAFFPIIISLWVLAPRQSSRDVFLNFTDNGAGWPSMGLTVLVGQVSAMFTVLGSDSVAHMAEEVQNAGVIVPQSMIWAYLLNIPFAFGALITYLYCIGNLQDAIASPSPFVFAFQQATGSSAGATGLTFIMFLLVVMIGISVFASTSRQTFAFGRDGGFPFPRWMGRVSPKTHVPLNSMYITGAFTLLISLIIIGSTAAFNAFLSLGVVGLMATYTISIGCVLVKRIRHPHELPSARWSLGRYGKVVNALAMLYSVWSFFWSFWPTVFRPTAETVNYACVIFVGIMLISSGFYIVRGRHAYDGPVAKVEGRQDEKETADVSRAVHG